jgi:hypothetical protein
MRKIHAPHCLRAVNPVRAFVLVPRPWFSGNERIAAENAPGILQTPRRSTSQSGFSLHESVRKTIPAGRSRALRAARPCRQG